MSAFARAAPLYRWKIFPLFLQWRSPFSKLCDAWNFIHILLLAKSMLGRKACEMGLRLEWLLYFLFISFGTKPVLCEVDVSDVFFVFLNDVDIHLSLEHMALGEKKLWATERMSQSFWKDFVTLCTLLFLILTFQARILMVFFYSPGAECGGIGFGCLLVVFTVWPLEILSGYKLVCLLCCVVFSEALSWFAARNLLGGECSIDTSEPLFCIFKFNAQEQLKNCLSEIVHAIVRTQFTPFLFIARIVLHGS